VFILCSCPKAAQLAPVMHSRGVRALASIPCGLFEVSGETRAQAMLFEKQCWGDLVWFSSDGEFSH
jgi:hypothetical protein